MPGTEVDVSGPARTGLGRPLIGISLFMALAFAGGYLRDAFIASQVGTQSIADGYFFGIQISLAVQAIFLLGGLAPAVVPALALVWQDQAEFAALARASLIWIVLATAATSLLLIAASGPLVHLLGSSLDPVAQRTAEVVLQTSALMLPLVAAGVTASAVANVQGRFILPAAAWALSNLGTAVLVIPLYRLSGTAGIGWAWTIGNLLYPLPVIVGIRHVSRGARWSPAHPRSVRAIFVALVAISAFFSTAQVSAIVERVIAAHLATGSIAQISYAQKLAIIPTSLLAGAVSTVVFPRLAFLANDREAGSRLLETSVRATLLPVVPLCAWLIVFGGLASAASFQRGALSSAAAAAIGQLLAIYATGMILVAISTILLRALFAIGRRRQALAVGVISTVCYIALAILFSGHGTVGLAWAWTTAQLVTVLAAGYALRWPEWGVLGRLAPFVLWVVTASAAGVGSDRLIITLFGAPSGVSRLPATIALAAFAAAISFGILLAAPLAESVRVRRRLGWGRQT